VSTVTDEFWCNETVVGVTQPRVLLNYIEDLKFTINRLLVSNVDSFVDDLVDDKEIPYSMQALPSLPEIVRHVHIVSFRWSQTKIK
jgi:hypothetical protein